VDNPTFALKIGLLIRRLRNQAGYSQEAFADHCGLHRVSMGIVERGEASPNIETIQKCCAGLEIKLSRFFTLLEEEPEPSSSQIKVRNRRPALKKPRKSSPRRIMTTESKKVQPENKK
jgi:transcriptional regulator with XRE-family HTH domain